MNPCDNKYISGMECILFSFGPFSPLHLCDGDNFTQKVKWDKSGSIRMKMVGCYGIVCCKCETAP